jgi:hypothetical protein
MLPSIRCEVDTGYTGIKSIKEKVSIPKKKSKKEPLSKGDKRLNRSISSSRVLVENVIRTIKIFRIVSERYRNRRKRFGLRFNLIAAITNLNRSII